MIAVISNKTETEVVKEFFQLFKTSWEFYQQDCSYQVLLSTRNSAPELNANLIIIYSSERTQLDSDFEIEVGRQQRTIELEWKGLRFPVYKTASTFKTNGEPLVTHGTTGQPVGIKVSTKGQNLVRIGYDLFREVSFLLTSGQPRQYAHIPTLDIHISILRNLILQAGIPLVEIPPVPAGHNFFVCLTHDVDFMGIKNHKFDHTMWGFLYRAIFSSLLKVIKRKWPLKKLLINWKSALTLPFVYLGWVRDFWIQFAQYMHIERDLSSTFFLIPFKDTPGENHFGPIAKRRAAKYDVLDAKPYVEKLLYRSNEISLHGLDAWRDDKKGKLELNRIISLTSRADIGVRMHWLNFADSTPELLEKAGFLYDSSLGYNDAIGYKAGTSQAFRPLGLKNLLELPLHIQDTAMLYPSRMSLPEDSAFDLCNTLIRNASAYGGVLVLNWHHRSLGPERLWSDLYQKLLNELKSRNACFCTARDVVKWFGRRRSVKFARVVANGLKMTIELQNKTDDIHPGLLLRIYTPETYEHSPFGCGQRHIDIPLSTEEKLEIPL